MGPSVMAPTPVPDSGRSGAERNSAGDGGVADGAETERHRPERSSERTDVPLSRSSTETTEHRTVDLHHGPGVVPVDRSAFGPHQGLFVVNHGPKAGARYALDTDLLTIGRDPSSDIFLDDITVSRGHAEVRRVGARYWIRDVGSLNGIYVNRQLTEDSELNEGDEVQIGKYKLVFVHGTSSV